MQEEQRKFFKKILHPIDEKEEVFFMSLIIIVEAFGCKL